MACISFDPTTGWWNIRFFVGGEKERVKRSLCKHTAPWTKARPPKRAPDLAMRLAEPYLEMERRAKLGQEVVLASKTPLLEYMLAYCDRASAHLRPRTVDNLRHVCRRFAKYCEHRKVVTVQAVSFAVCRDWISCLLKDGFSRSTVVVRRAQVGVIWAAAKKERIVSENPWLDAKVPGKSRQEVPTAWTREETTKLIAATDGWLRDLVLLGLNTGIRISALLALRWSAVDWTAGLVRVRAADSKSGVPYEVPITDSAHDVLARRQATQKDGPNGFVFVRPATGLPYSRQTTYRRIGRAVKRAGISDYGDYNHCMRRTFGTLALNAGVPLEVVSKCLGHATLAQTQRAYASILATRLKSGMAGFDLAPGGP